MGFSSYSNVVEFTIAAGVPLTENLISFWELEEDSEPFLDSVSSNDLAVGYVDPTKVASRVGYGQQFTTAAGGPLLSCASNASLQTGDIDFSVAFWFKYGGSLSGSGAVLVNKFFGGAHGEWRVIFNPSTASFAFNIVNSSGTPDGVGSPDGTVVVDSWYYVVAVCDKTNSLIKISINGAAFITATKTVTVSTSSSGFQMGDHDFLTNGALDQVGFWKRALTQDDVTALYNDGDGMSYAYMIGPSLADDLVVYYELDDTGWADSVGSNDLTPTNSPTATLGKVRNAALFSAASSQSLSHASNSTFEISGIDFSFATWVRWDDGSFSGIPIARITGSSSNGYTLFAVSPDSTYIQFRVYANSSGSIVNSSIPITTGVWYFVVCKWVHSEKKAYISVNGGAFASSTANANTVQTDTSSSFYLGGSAFYHTGAIDQFGLWKRALTYGDVTALYNGGIGLSYDQVVGTFGPTSYLNEGGTGDRNVSILVSCNFTVLSNGFRAMLDGGKGDTESFFWDAVSVSTSDQIVFDFGYPRYIDEAKWYQDSTSTHGVWQWHGSNDGSTLTAIGSSFTLGCDTNLGFSTYVGVQTEINTTNPDLYRYYILKGVSGTRNATPWLREIEFKISEHEVQTQSYMNVGGSGNRSGIVSVSANFSVSSGSPPFSALLNGSYLSNDPNACYWDAASASGHQLVFDFGSPVCVTEARWSQTNADGHGTWKWIGSSNGSTGTDIGSSFTLGSTGARYQGPSNQTQIHTALNGNTNSYRYYILEGVSGTQASGPWLLEIEFKIDEVYTAASSEADAFFDRAPTMLSAFDKKNYEELIAGLVSDGVWSDLDVIYIYAGPNALTSNLNLKSSSYTTVPATVAPLFAAHQGYTGNLTSAYLTTGYNPSVGGLNYSIYSASISYYIRNNPSGSFGVAVGAYDGTYLNDQINKSSDVTIFRINSFGADLSQYANTDRKGMYVNNRSSVTAVQCYKDGSLVDTDSISANGIPTYPVFVLARNDSGSANSFSGEQIAFLAMGGSLNSTKAAALASRVNTFMTAYGVNVY